MNKRNPLLRILSCPALLLRPFFCALLLLTVSAHADNGTNQAQDLTTLPLEQLMQIEVPTVVSASKFEQPATEAPSSVTVITSDEIKRYGWRTLGDVLASVPGFYVSYDRDYAYLGTSGVNLGDANSRILLLVNGHRVNNDLNDSAAIDTSFILDLDLIDRIEIIRGPGSVLYGNNAFFGVINVITRKNVNGVEASGAYGSFNAASGRVTVGNQFTNGLNVLLSGTIYHNDGPENLYYPQFNTPSQNNGIAHDMDSDEFGSFFGSAGYKDFTLEGAFIKREKENPTAQYDTTFNDSRLRTIDDRGYATLKYAHKFLDDWNVSGDIYYDRSDFQIGYPQDPNFYKEQQTGQWAGSELQVNKQILDRFILTAGAEYRNDFEQDASFSGSGLSGSAHDRRQNYGFFAEGDYSIVTNLHVNAGLRYDQYGHFDPSWSPRAALIYNPFSQSTFKFIYGTAFRDPNFTEVSDSAFQNIQPEKITSYDLVYEQGIARYLRSSISGYYNRLDNLIGYDESGDYVNFNADTLGLELALEAKWQNEISARLSYSLQHTENRDTDEGLPDSPMNMIKFNISAPLLKDKIFASLEVQYTSQSKTVYTDFSTGETLPGPDAPGYAVVNFTLFSQNLVKNLDVSASVYNLLNTKYYEPASNFHLQNDIQQDGITFRVKLTYRF
jgi:outer membrane cobalamin receptor